MTRTSISMTRSERAARAVASRGGDPDRRRGRHGRRQRPARLPGRAGVLEGVSPLCEARARVHGDGQSPLVPKRSGTGLGLLRPSPDALPRDQAARRIRHPPPLDGPHAPRRVRLHFERRRAFPEGRLSPEQSLRGPRHDRRDAVPRRVRRGDLPGGSLFTGRSIPRPCAPFHPLPSCPRCGGLARPNILMFGDWGWDSVAVRDQQRRLQSWLASVAGARIVVVECGAGTAIPTVRLTCEEVARSPRRHADPHQSPRAGSSRRPDLPADGRP